MCPTKQLDQMKTAIERVQKCAHTTTGMLVFTRDVLEEGHVLYAASQERLARCGDMLRTTNREETREPAGIAGEPVTR